MKKNFVKRAACLVLGMSMLVGSMAGCGSKEVEKDENQTDFYVMGGMSALSAGYDSNVVLNQLAENVGISIEWDTMSDSLSEQVNIRIAGEQLPDAFQGVGFSSYDISTYGEDGVFIDLTPYINEEVMPNLTKILEENPDIRSAITMPDGKIYGLPAAEQMGTGGIGLQNDYSIYTVPQFSMINKAWLDELGLPVPTTLDELYNCLVAFKENDMSHTYYGNAEGTTIPMSTGFDQWCWGQNVFYAGFGFTNWPNDICNDMILQDDGTVDFVSTWDGYRDAVSYFHNWYAEGLMDIEMFSQSTSQLIAKCSQGQVGVATWWYIEEVMGDKSEDYVFLPILAGPDGTYNVTVRDGGAVNSGNLNITSACGNPEALLKFYDQWYDGEIVMQLQYGPIGTYFTEQDEKGMWISITDAEAREKFGKSAGELKGVHEVYGPKLILSKYYNENFYMEDRAIVRLQDLNDSWVEPYVKSMTTYPIDVVFNEEELEVIDRYKADFESAVSEQEALWIKNGGPTDEEWKQYVDMLVNNCGLEKLKAVYQSAYDRYSGK